MGFKIMYTFQDFYDNNVRLSFEDHPFSTGPKHVWVICRYRGQWLLTEHKRRGLEFPGGKVEQDELPIDAAVREVNEETGALVSDIKYVGQYEVCGKGGTIIKNVYFANIQSLEKKETYFETNGPVLLDTLPINVKEHPKYSFMMKDDVLVQSLEHIKKLSVK